MLNEIVLGGLTSLFGIGAINYIDRVLSLRKSNKAMTLPEINYSDLEMLALQEGKEVPKISLLIPAYKETGVIENSIRRLSELDYSDNFDVYIITDEREKQSSDESTESAARPTADQINKLHGREMIHIISVPETFDGKFPFTGNLEIEKSSKGRALNFGLVKIEEYERNRQDKTDMVGVFDADARPHREVLKYIAEKRLKENTEVLQGPVLQVSNYNNVSWIGKFAGLSLSLYQLTKFPSMNENNGKKLRFLAGTNTFLSMDSLREVEGWRPGHKVDDAELAVRLFERGIYPHFHPCEEIEQTPPSFGVWKRQRSRWAEGFWDLTKDIKESENIPWSEKMRFLVRQYASVPLSMFYSVVPVAASAIPFVGIYDTLSDLPSYFKVLGGFLLASTAGYLSMYPYLYHKFINHIESKDKLSKTIKLIDESFDFSPEGYIGFTTRKKDLRRVRRLHRNLEGEWRKGTLKEIMEDSHFEKLSEKMETYLVTNEAYSIINNDSVHFDGSKIDKIEKLFSYHRTGFPKVVRRIKNYAMLSAMTPVYWMSESIPAIGVAAKRLFGKSEEGWYRTVRTDERISA